MVDRGSVNTGAKSGLVQRLSARLGRDVLMLHCVAHRTSLVGSVVLREPSKAAMRKLPPEEEKINKLMRELRMVINAGAGASHVPAIEGLHYAFMVASGDGDKYEKVPTLAPSLYFCMAPVMDTLLQQWVFLFVAAVETGRTPGGFKACGQKAGVLKLTAALRPAFMTMNAFCVYEQSSALHAGSLRSTVDGPRENLRALYGLGGGGGEGEAVSAGVGAAADNDSGPFIGPDFERFT
jgi:hypothetical protein